MDTRSKQIVLDIWGVDDEQIRDHKFLEMTIRKAAHKSRSTVVGFVDKEFQPEGYSAVVLLAESHISVHTFPEERYMSVDVYTCGNTDPWEAAKYILNTIKHEKHQIQTLVRGDKDAV